MTGTLVGSPHHMAPEIVEGREADARSDLFSLGTLLYWLATGALPFAASNPTAILRRVLEGDFADPRTVDPRVCDPLAELVTRCLATDPARRPQTAAEVRDGLDRILAEVGVEHPADELRAFLRDPPAYRATFPARAVAALSALADAAAGEGATARALGYYARVLAIDPQDPNVPARIARLARRVRARRIAAWAGVAALSVALLAGGTFAFVWARAHHPPPPPAPRAPPAALPEAAATAAPLPVAAPAPGRETGPPSARPPAPSPAPTILPVLVRPYAQRAMLDGVEVAREEQNVRFALSPGRAHEIRIEHPCCTPFVRNVTAAEAARIGELRVPLAPRPARVRVEGDPGTRVYVNDRLLGTAGESQRVPFAVPVPEGGETPYEAPARIRLEPPAFPPRTVEARLRAGADLVVAAPQTENPP
jgi:serine/threonine-protein kinase